VASAGTNRVTLEYLEQGVAAAVWADVRTPARTVVIKPESPVDIDCFQPGLSLERYLIEVRGLPDQPEVIDLQRRLRQPWPGFDEPIPVNPLGLPQ
jgi:hypothetical protein